VRESRLHAIITQCDIAGEKHETVARDLGLSLRQFYRERNAAILRLRDALHDELASSETAAGNNLPWQPTSFVGRASEVEEIDGLLGPRRLVTVTGSGGTGKTRIVIEVASRRSVPRDGTWFVDLAAVSDEALVLSKIAAVLDIGLPDHGDRRGALIAAMKSRDPIVILDNCEHVIDAVRAIAEAILQACPHVALVATSRERLGIAGEHTYPLPTLPVPSKPVTSAVEARSYAALELFAERAATAQHALSDEQFEDAAEICRRLDGIALSIELAAARLPVLGLPALRHQLTQHFRVLSGGNHDLPARHHTLNAMITWSYDLLCDRDRMLFRRLAVFARGWTLEAAEAVCADDALPKDTVLDGLFSLVEKSLVVVDLTLATPRYAFFESTRVYALERLVAVGERETLSISHVRWIAEFSDRAYDDFHTMPLARWYATIAPELDNVLAALDWALCRDGDVVLGARVASGLHAFWTSAGLGKYGQHYIQAVIERIDQQEHPVLGARLLLAQCSFLYGTHNVDAVRRAMALLAGIDDRRMLARCQVSLAFAYMRMGLDAQAEEASDAARTLLHAVGLARSPLYSRFLNDRATLLRRQGRVHEAKALLAESLALASALQDVWATSLCQTLLAEIEFASGDPHRAVALGNEALIGARGVRMEIFTMCNLVCYHMAIGEIDAAEEHARNTLDLARHSHPNVVIATLQHLATIAAMRGAPSRAARVLGYVNAWYERIGSLRDSTDQRCYDVLMASLRDQLMDDEIVSLLARGAGFAEDDAVDAALGHC
jgi:predicted ATPase